MARTTKLSVEKALNAIRKAEAPKSSQRDQDSEALNEEIARLRAQRMRLEQLQRKRT